GWAAAGLLSFNRAASRSSRERPSRGWALGHLGVGVVLRILGASLDHVFQALFADLAVKRRAADAEAPGHLAHVAGVDLDGELDQVALDLLQRAQVAALVEDAHLHRGRQ